jgi:hypothetical protein
VRGDRFSGGGRNRPGALAPGGAGVTSQVIDATSRHERAFYHVF